MGQSSIVLAEAPLGGGEKMEHQEALEQGEMQFRGSFWETGAQRWKVRGRPAPVEGRRKEAAMVRSVPKGPLTHLPSVILQHSQITSPSPRHNLDPPYVRNLQAYLYTSNSPLTGVLSRSRMHKDPSVGLMRNARGR